MKKMEESSVSTDVNKIQTFVFVDLESTGLPIDSPKILELSLIAVSREDLLKMKDSTPNVKRASSPSISCSLPSLSLSTNSSFIDNRLTMSQPTPKCANNSQLIPRKLFPPTSPSRCNSVPKLPRVMHKYTRLYYPWKLVTSGAEHISGLNNEMLQHLPQFNKNSAQALSLFLNLPKPVALVAHNGSRFDFKLLKAELSNVECESDFIDLQCIDTLKAIKDIDALHEKEDIQEITLLAESFSYDDPFDDDFMEPDSPPVCKRIRSEEEVNIQPNQAFLDLAQFNDSSQLVNQVHHPLLEVSGELPITPIKVELLAPVTTPATPDKLNHSQSSAITPEFGKHNLSHGFNRGPCKVRRSLTYEGCAKRKLIGSMPYTQGSIYYRLFGTNYKCHRAETDCQALLEICGHYGEKFVEWADTFSEKFSKIQPMWIKRKAFSLS